MSPLDARMLAVRELLSKPERGSAVVLAFSEVGWRSISVTSDGEGVSSRDRNAVCGDEMCAHCCSG